MTRKASVCVERVGMRRFHSTSRRTRALRQQNVDLIPGRLQPRAIFGATFDDVVRVNVFLLNMADRDGFNATYLRYFNGRMPTRRLIGAGDLYKGILVEIDGIAYVGDQDQGRAR